MPDPAETQQAVYDRAVLTLSHGVASTRMDAARVLRRFGRRAVKPLCAALKDREPEVRATAAAVLGDIGDPHAAAPLIAALRACLAQRSAREHRIGGVLLALTLCWVPPALAGSWEWVAAVGTLYVAVFAIFVPPVWMAGRRRYSGVCRTITHALARIAERNPTVEVRAIVPELNAIAGDLIRQEAETRVASRDAVRRIEAATERLKSLPLPTAGEAPIEASLPRVGGEPAGLRGNLPRVNEHSAPAASCDHSEVGGCRDL